MAGLRVQIIKPDLKRVGYLEFDTELVAAADRSLVALMGACPGASTAAHIATQVLEICFPEKLTSQHWLPTLKEIIPSYGASLVDDASLCSQLRAQTAEVLRIKDIAA